MAKDKKSFILYSDVQGLINQLPDDVAGRLLKHIYAYVNDENPVSDELLLNIAFEPIKMSLKRDLVKWGETREGRSKAGKASAEAKRLAKEAEQNSTNSTNVDFVQQNSTNSTVSVSVSDSVNDILLKKETKDSEKVDWGVLLEYFNNITGKRCKVVNDKTRKQIKARLKEGYTKLDIANAIKNCMKSKWHIEDNFNTLTLEFITRADKLEKYCQIETTNSEQTTQIKKHDD